MAAGEVIMNESVTNRIDASTRAKAGPKHSGSLETLERGGPALGRAVSGQEGPEPQRARERTGL